MEQKQELLIGLTGLLNEIKRQYFHNVTMKMSPLSKSAKKQMSPSPMSPLLFQQSEVDTVSVHEFNLAEEELLTAQAAQQRDVDDFTLAIFEVSHTGEDTRLRL